ncbi:MAG: BrnT family toxin [Beijerinckiaceae bacterium]|nr:BrnT family toxin [Beijerinckiaceae bacterium]
MIDLSQVTGFDWDDGNRRKNEKHGVSMAEAEQVFFNQPLLIVDDDKHSTSEARFHALGVTHEQRPLHITFTIRANGRKLRVISARTMSVKERMIYVRHV